MSFFKLLFSIMVSYSLLHGMEKSDAKEQIDAGARSQPTQKQKKASALQKYALKASQIAARNGHTGAARFAASMGDSESPTLAVHQASLTKNPEKKSKLIEKAALLNPGRVSTAKEMAAQSKYDSSLKTAHGHLQNAKQFMTQLTNSEHAELQPSEKQLMLKRIDKELSLHLSLYEEELKNVDTYYRELRRAQDFAQEITADASKLEEAVLINNLEVRYTYELELVADFYSRKMGLDQEFYLRVAFDHFKKRYTLIHPNSDQKKLDEEIKAEFDILYKEISGEEELSSQSIEQTDAEPSRDSDDEKESQ